MSPTDIGDGKKDDGGGLDQAGIKAIFPERITTVMIVAICFGTAAAVAGLVIRRFDASLASQSNLAFSLGVGLILVAFGGQATARFGQFILAGIVGVVGFLIWWLDYTDIMRIKKLSESFTIATIDGVDTRIYTPEWAEKTGVYSALRRENQQYKSIISNTDDVGPLHLEIVINNEKRKEIPECVHTNSGELCSFNYLLDRTIFNEAFNGHRNIHWKFDKSTNKILNYADNSPIASPQETARPRSEGMHDLKQPTRFGGALISLAFAQSKPMRPACGGAPQGSGSDVDDQINGSIKDLVDDDVVIRRASRDFLGSVGPCWVKKIANGTLGSSDYRAQLGGVVALTQILRENKNSAKEISGQLEQKNIDSLVAAAIDKDRTLRIYAGEFLYDLGDPRTIAPALQRMPTLPDPGDAWGDNARFNLILVMSDGLKSTALDPGIKLNAENELKSLRPRVGAKTQQLVDGLLAQK